MGRSWLLVAALGLVGVLWWATGGLETAGLPEPEDVSGSTTTTALVLNVVSLGQLLDDSDELVALRSVSFQPPRADGQLVFAGTIIDQLSGPVSEEGRSVTFALRVDDSTVALASSGVLDLWVLLSRPLAPSDVRVDAIAVLGRRNGTLEVLAPAVDVPITALDPEIAPLEIVERWVSSNGEPSPPVLTDLQLTYRLASAADAVQGASEP